MTQERMNAAFDYAAYMYLAFKTSVDLDIGTVLLIDNGQVDMEV